MDEIEPVLVLMGYEPLERDLVNEDSFIYLCINITERYYYKSYNHMPFHYLSIKVNNRIVEEVNHPDICDIVHEFNKHIHLL